MLKSANYLLNLTGSKKNLGTTLSRGQRLAMLEENSEFSISSQCDMLSLNRTGIYYKAREISPEKQVILNAMDAIFTENPVYGSRRITAELRRQGYNVCRPTVSGYMKILGLEAIHQKPGVSKPHPGHKIYPYLLRNVSAAYPNHIWGTDITYIRLRDGFMYLVAYLDWYSRYVVAWELSDTLEDDFVVQALKAALKVGKPHIVNSDQGSQFTGNAHTSTLLQEGINISMDGKGRCMDNIFTERLWRTIKYEDIYIKDYSSPGELRRGLREFFEHYNTKRVHQALGYKIPSEIYFE